GNGRGHRHRRPRGLGRSCSRRLLQGNAPAGQGGGRPGQPTRHPHPRRASQRSRPGPTSGPHIVVRPPGRRRPDGGGLLPRPVGSGADGQPHRRHGRRPPGGGRHRVSSAGGDDRPPSPDPGRGRRPPSARHAPHGPGIGRRNPSRRRWNPHRGQRRRRSRPEPPRRRRPGGSGAASGGADGRVSGERVPVPGRSPMSLLALYRHHVRSLTRPGRLLLTTLLALIPAGIVLVSGLAGGGSDDVTAGVVANVGATSFPIAVLILASATLRDERDDGTLPYLYLAPITRPAMAGVSI